MKFFFVANSVFFSRQIKNIFLFRQIKDVYGVLNKKLWTAALPSQCVHFDSDSRRINICPFRQHSDKLLSGGEEMREAIWKFLCSDTEKTSIPFPFILNWIWKSIWFKIERKTVNTIISDSI